MSRHYRAGDRVVYTRDKCTSCPGPRAKNVDAAPKGELYQYQVDKFWRVAEVAINGDLILKTRRGKSHRVQDDDPRLRKASLFEILFRRKYFPARHGDMSQGDAQGRGSSQGQLQSPAV